MESSGGVRETGIRNIFTATEKTYDVRMKLGGLKNGVPSSSTPPPPTPPVPLTPQIPIHPAPFFLPCCWPSTIGREKRAGRGAVRVPEAAACYGRGVQLSGDW